MCAGLHFVRLPCSLWRCVPCGAVFPVELSSLLSCAMGPSFRCGTQHGGLILQLSMRLFLSVRQTETEWMVQVCMAYCRIMPASSAMLQAPSANASNTLWTPAHLVINHPKNA